MTNLMTIKPAKEEMAKLKTQVEPMAFIERKKCML